LAVSVSSNSTSSAKPLFRSGEGSPDNSRDGDQVCFNSGRIFAIPRQCWHPAWDGIGIARAASNIVAFANVQTESRPHSVKALWIA